MPITSTEPGCRYIRMDSFPTPGDPDWPTVDGTPLTEKEFDECIDRLEALGLVRRWTEDGKTRVACTVDGIAASLIERAFSE